MTHRLSLRYLTCLFLHVLLLRLAFTFALPKTSVGSTNDVDVVYTVESALSGKTASTGLQRLVLKL